jgi:hypothetical protein
VIGISVSDENTSHLSILGTYEWSDPTAISLDNKTIYYPAGNGRIGYFTVNDDPEIPPEFGYAYDKFSKPRVRKLHNPNSKAHTFQHGRYTLWKILSG